MKHSSSNRSSPTRLDVFYFVARCVDSALLRYARRHIESSCLFVAYVPVELCVARQPALQLYGYEDHFGHSLIDRPYIPLDAYYGQRAARYGAVLPVVEK